MKLEFEITASGLITSLGDNLPLLRAALSAGLSGYCRGAVAVAGTQPTLAPVPDAALPAPPAASTAPRFWQLLAGALRGIDRAAPVIINTASVGAIPPAEERAALAVDYLGYAPGRLSWFAGGRAGLPQLLEGAARFLAGGASAVALAAVESGCEASELERLCASGRALSPGNADGRVAAEAVVAICLSRGQQLQVVGMAASRTQAWDQQPDVGVLAEALNLALDAAGAPPLGAVYSTATGERAAARELALALTRAQPGTAAGARVELPARLMGDTGAAAPLLQLLLASGESRFQALLAADDAGGRSAAVVRFRG